MPIYMQGTVECDDCGGTAPCKVKLGDGVTSVELNEGWHVVENSANDDTLTLCADCYETWRDDLLLNMAEGGEA